MDCESCITVFQTQIALQGIEERLGVDRSRLISLELAEASKRPGCSAVDGCRLDGAFPVMVNANEHATEVEGDGLDGEHQSFSPWSSRYSRLRATCWSGSPGGLSCSMIAYWTPASLAAGMIAFQSRMP